MSAPRLMAVAAACAALAACGTTRGVTPVPVGIPCKVTLPAKPAFAFDSLPPGSDIFTQVKTLLADRKQRIAYEREVEAAARSCSV